MRPLAIAIATTILLTSIPFAHSDAPDWDGLRRNPFLWGQMTGCLMRFRLYADNSELEYVTSEQVEQMLHTYFGDIDDTISQLIELGEEIGVVEDDQAHWELLRVVAQSELEEGSAWLQSFTCYAGLQDYGLVK